MKQKTLDIYFCADAGYAMGFFVTLVTLLDHFSRKVTPIIHIADNGLTEEFLTELRLYLERHPANPQLIVRKVEEEHLLPFRDQTYYLDRNEFRPATISRLALPIIFPESQFGVYVDCDFFIQKDFAELLRYENEETEILAIQDRYIDTMDSPVELLNCEEFDVDPQAPYFNGGFLVMNLKRWDREAYWKTIQATSRRGKMYWEDQSLLNLVFCNRWKPLDESWNRMVWPEHIEYSFPKKNTNYHFFGGQKPWSFSPDFSVGLVRQFYNTLEKNKIGGFDIPRPKRPHSIWWFKNLVASSLSKETKVQKANWD